MGEPTRFVFTLFCLVYVGKVCGEITCPSYQELPSCTCFVLDGQLHIQCPGTDIPSLKKSLEVLNGPVKSFSVYDLDSRATLLPNGLSDNVTSPIFHLQLSHSSLEDLGEESLKGLAKSLESLAVTSAHLKFIPQATLSTLKRLKLVDFEANQISELGPYSFHNILLQKVNLKGNQLENVSEHAFWGLEETLMEIDMSENKIREFPYSALRRLHLLTSLNLAWNEIGDLSALLYPHPDALRSPNQLSPFEWPLLKYLNLDFNYLKKLEKETFIAMGNMRTLSVHMNSLEIVEEGALAFLRELESINLSNNKISILGVGTFRHNSRLVTVDLSNNHLHLLPEDLLSNLAELREVFLNGNNILQLNSGTFVGSPKISVVNVKGNALRFVESGVFSPLRNLTDVKLSDNFLRILPQDIFLQNENLASVSLDGNLLVKIEPGTFHNSRGLRELRLQNNEISAIPSGVIDVLPLLEDLYLENNKLTTLRGLDSLKRIRHVTLSRNHLERLTADMLPSIELSSLSLGSNLLRNIEEGSFANQTTLNWLFLANNRLARIGGKVFYGLKNIQRIYLQNNNISWIHDGAFSSQTKALQYIDLSHNSLKSISRPLFGGLAFIEEINLSFNQITYLEEGAFSNLGSLRNLDLSNNRLTSLEYSGALAQSGIEILKLGGNILTEIQFDVPGIGLKELDLKYNFLNAKSLRNLELGKLEMLQVSGNNLTDLDEGIFSRFPSLSFLAAEKCQVTSLPAELFRKNPNLAVIRLNENLLTWIPDTLFTPGGRVKELHLKYNKLRAFPYKALSNTTNLEVLTLSGNRISNLELNRIRLPRLNQFDVNDNRLSKISISGGGLAKAMPSLSVIDFGENNISRLNEDFFKNLSISQVNLGGNYLQKIPFVFAGLDTGSGAGYVLNMSGNPLLNFYTENHPSWNFTVMNLYLSDTNVSYLSAEEFKVYPNLHRLVIKRTPLASLPAKTFASLNLLNLLDLSENEIEVVNEDSFAGLGQLKSLNLSSNRIKTLTSFHRSLNGLQDLDLSHNRLSRLLPEAFANLQSLNSLRLRGNWITGLPAELFGPLPRLGVLDLSHNFIETVPNMILRHLETRISTFRLEENPLSCDCDNKELWEWLQTHPKIFAASIKPSSSSGGAMGPGGGSGGPSSLPALPGSSSSLSAGQPNFICDRPEELRGRPMLESDLPAFCSSPAIVKLDIDEIRQSSALVTWQGRNNSGMHGYLIAYHALNHNDVVRSRALPATSRDYTLPDLQSDTAYLVCVLGLANEDNANVTASALMSRSPEVLLKDSQFSKCKEVRTLVHSNEIVEKASFLQRRLGVVVGAVVGIVVFVVLITTLGCMKLRSGRAIRQQQQQQNGKVEPSVGVALGSSNNVGTLGGYHQQSNHLHHLHHHHHHGNGNGTGTLGRNGSHTSPGNLSPEFITYRHYSLNTDGGLHSPHTATAELERL